MLYRSIWSGGSLALVISVAGCPQPKPGTDRADTGQGGDLGVSLLDAGLDMGRDLGMDTGIDVGPEDIGPGDMGMPDPNFTTAEITGGGGRAQSTSFRVRVVIGAPSPGGRAQSTHHRAVLGVGALHHPND